MLFKLAFHTYEHLSNKMRVQEKKAKAQKEAEAGSRSAPPSGMNDDLDLISNRSDESTMTVGGAGAARERKLQRFEESLDVKLNETLMKW